MKCDDRLLLELLNEDNETKDAAAARHLDECPRCQRRLAELAADHDSWREVTAALSAADASSSVVVAVDPELTPEIPVQADRISLDFLGEPSHPEMLGRIGRYDVERLVGAGGMGIVFKAFDTDLHRPVAVKVLAPHLAHSGGARQRFAREAQSAAAVVHENVVPIHNVDAEGKLPFLVMQFVPGESLQARIDRDGPAAIEETLRIGAQIADGLAAAHAQGLVHRDVKPGNVLLGDGVDRVLISDFGLARAADDASVTRSGVIAGTPHYMSPEQARGESIDYRSDLFSLGSVLYFMCTGHAPFRADGAMAVLNRICTDKHRPVDVANEQIPADLAKLIDKLLEKSVGSRPQTATMVSHELRRQLQDSRSRKRFRKAHRRRHWAAATCFGVLLFLTAFFVYVLDVLGPANAPDSGAQNSNSPVQAAAESLEIAPEQNTPLSPPISEQPFAERPEGLAPALDMFRDELFFEQVSRIGAEASEWELRNAPPLEELPHQERSWFDELESASRAVEAYELGVDEITAPAWQRANAGHPWK